jgi:hypothetical protein
MCLLCEDSHTRVCGSRRRPPLISAGLEYTGISFGSNLTSISAEKWYINCWGLVLKCYELRTRQHKMLNVNAFRPSKHYFP